MVSLAEKMAANMDASVGLQQSYRTEKKALVYGFGPDCFSLGHFYSVAGN